ncbi:MULTISPECIES: hypothetical protein [unclassified Brevundimonas]|uniref:hypothetical protein n=1 Tax=unclassified Brevundimonas TaxID=2622653 RepID=UPI003F913C72
MNVQAPLYFLAAIFAATAAPADDRERAQSEYGFVVRFPAGKAICDSRSGEHPQGWVMPLDGDCAASTRRIIVLANYNAAFRASPRAATNCSVEKFRAAGRAGLALSFNGRPSATCLERRSNGTVLVTVATQAGQWPLPQPDDPAAYRTPWINYYAYLETTRAKLDEDLKLFRSVIDSVRINTP